MSFFCLYCIFIVTKKISPKQRHSPPGNVIEEKIQPLYGGRSQTPTSGHLSKASKGNCGHFVTQQGVSRVGLMKGHTSPPLVGQSTSLSSQHEHDTAEGERTIDVNTSPLSSSKPPRVRKAHSAGQLNSNSRSPSPSSSSVHHNEEYLSDSPASKKAKVAWGSAEQGRWKDLNGNESIESETISNGPTDSEIRDGLRGSCTQLLNSPQNISSVSSFREYDEDTLSVLNISFPPSSTPTFGLSRAVSPPESQLERYSSLVENAIVTNMVAPLSKEWKKKTHDFLPKGLRQDFKETLDELDKVSYIHCIVNFHKI